ncbi:unnamed protein product, partial [Sphenostylis stenocarpa]
FGWRVLLSTYNRERKESTSCCVQKMTEMPRSRRRAVRKLNSISHDTVYCMVIALRENNNNPGFPTILATESEENVAVG